MFTLETQNINKDIDNLNLENQYYIYHQSETNDFPIIAEIKGPNNTPYEGGVFSIEISSNNVKFITKICSIFVNINTGEILNKEIIKSDDEHKVKLADILNFIRDEILISPNSTKLIDRLTKWISGKAIYFEYLKRIKSFTQKYANKNGIKIKVDEAFLSNQDFSKYENKNEANIKNKKLNNEFKNLDNIKIEGFTNEEFYICPFNNFKQLYFEILGRPGTPYEGGVFQFLIEMPPQYPFKYGECIFRTKIFHSKYNENNSKLCEIDFEMNWRPTKGINDTLSYYIGTMNKYDYICHQNIEAKNLVFTNFKEFLKKSKYFTKKYANLEGIKLKPNFNLIEKPAEELNIQPPTEKDFMPKIEKEIDNSIKEEEIEVLVNKLFSNEKFKLNVKTTDFVVDIAIKIRDYIIKNDKNNDIVEYKNLLPTIMNPKQRMELNKQIGHYNIKNGEQIIFNFNFPTCVDS